MTFAENSRILRDNSPKYIFSRILGTRTPASNPPPVSCAYGRISFGGSWQATCVHVCCACTCVQGTEPAVTNCDDCGGLESVNVHQLCLDYIWYCPQSLGVTAVLETPPAEVITQHYALPSEQFPSDHIPLLAQFRFTSPAPRWQTPPTPCDIVTAVSEDVLIKERSQVKLNMQ